MSRTEQRILDAVVAHPGRTSDAIAAGLGMPWNSFTKGIRLLRERGAVTLSSELVPVEGFTGWHLLNTWQRDTLLSLCDGNVTVEMIASDIGVATETIGSRVLALRRIGALHPPFLVWTSTEADRLRDVAWDAYMAWSKSQKRGAA